ncbi:acyl-CoA thioesterase [Polymorphospora rubra]|uniref:4-hydroxybenzoyl-CoA thioesterase n=1 Tax=Polymorphospora rubra TaxID=338584 RepID=A0A810MZT5_9ACTN|nr:acyl-CoA thioesterase [Polymorphospora rubra]BCJ66647.1 4-hydroxybenzoyl-CoA thioesterase [Polymorphospora rubra]
MSVYVYRHLVTLDETNLVGNVYFAHYLHWQGHCRERFLVDHAPGVMAALQSGELALVTVSCAMDYYAECFGLDLVEVQMTLRDTGGNRIAMDFRFRRGDETVAVGRQTVGCLRRAEPHPVPVPVPEELVRAAAAFPS